MVRAGRLSSVCEPSVSRYETTTTTSDYAYAHHPLGVVNGTTGLDDNPLDDDSQLCKVAEDGDHNYTVLPNIHDASSASDLIPLCHSEDDCVAGEEIIEECVEVPLDDDATVTNDDFDYDTPCSIASSVVEQHDLLPIDCCVVQPIDGVDDDLMSSSSSTFDDVAVNMTLECAH